MMRCALLLLVSCCIASAANADESAASDTGFIWIEGESARRNQTTRHNWYDDVKKDVLSGNEWLSHFDPQQAGTADYEFTVAQADSYTFWLRANPVAARLSWQLDDAADWKPVDFASSNRDRINIAADDKPDLRFITWIRVGQIQLTAGRHTLRFRLHSGPQNHGGIDCFVLTRIPFVPAGTTRPQSRSGPSRPDEWFPVILDTDPLSVDSVIDVSHLIDAPAGQHGFLQRDAAALRFEQQSQPVKFWGAGAGPLGNSSEQMTQAARWFRKHGINLVRQHTMLNAVGLLNDDGEFDPDRMDRYDRWFAALKREGIYSTWSVIYPHHGALLRRGEVDASLFDELNRADKERDGARQPIVVNDYINLDRRLQDVTWKYFDRLLRHVNPYTGLAYRDDPALAIVEIQNESNVFFFTLNSLAAADQVPELSQMMRRRFFSFVKAKYGTQANTRQAWGQLQRQDDWQRGELQLMGAHHWGSEGPEYEFAGQDRRCGDYIEFLTSIQREYFTRRVTQLRDAGFKGVTVTTAWKSGGPGASLANLYCDTAADCIDRHNYFGGGDGGHNIVAGKVNTSTHLNQPGHGLLAIGLFQVHDRPFACSEWSQMPPNPFKAEAAPLMAFYGMGLQGWDASYHFSLEAARIGDGWPGQRKYCTQTPHYIGQFPALAFAVHNNHIAEGDIVALRRVSQQDIFAGRDVLGQSLSAGGFDTKELAGRLTTPPAALAAGRVTIDFNDGTSSAVDLTKYHDPVNRVIRSTTGQLVWRYGDRRVEVRSPKTQGIIGFSDHQAVDLPDVSVTLNTPFVSLLFTPLDNLDLAHSKRILITAMARDRQTGSEFNDDWSQLITRGGPPLLMEPVQARIQFKGTPPGSVRPLDLYGVPRDKELTLDEQGQFNIDGTSATYYYEVRR
jgi:hypothetical protein